MQTRKGSGETGNCKAQQGGGPCPEASRHCTPVLQRAGQHTLRASPAQGLSAATPFVDTAATEAIIMSARGCVPIKLWGLTSEFHILVTCHKILFFFWPFKNIKPFLAHRLSKNRWQAKCSPCLRARLSQALARRCLQNQTLSFSGFPCTQPQPLAPDSGGREDPQTG